MGNVSEDILRTIAHDARLDQKLHGGAGLVKNSKTPVAITMNLMQRLNDSDVKKIASDRNVPEALRLGGAEAECREPVERKVSSTSRTPPRFACAHSDRICDRPSIYTAARWRASSSGNDFNRSIARSMSWRMVALVAA